MAKASQWISVFEDFIKDLRISSKEAPSEDERGAPLMLWESQRRFLNFVGTGLDDGIRQFYTLKSRQLGMTTISLALDLFWCAMNKNMFGALVTDNEKNRDINRMILRKYVNSFPKDYFGEEFYIVKDNRSFIEFSNGSRLDLLVAGTKAKSVSWAEGAGYVMAHLTEVGKYGSADGVESFMEALPQQNPNRLLIAESTANGFNVWRSMYMSAKDDPYTKRTLFCGWWSSDMNAIPRSDPRFLQYGTYAASGEERERVAAVAHLYGWRITPEQLAWIRWRQDNVGEADGIFAQNQPWTEDDAFVMSGYSFFQSRQVAKDIKEIIDAPPAPVEEGGYGYAAYRYELDGSFFDIKLHPIEDGEDREIELRVWEEPVAEGKYVIGMDPAWGRNDHKDRHGIEVYRCFGDKLIQVAEYASANVEVKHAAWVVAHLAGAYTDCIVNIDLNGPGRALMMEWEHVRDLLNAQMNEGLVRARDWENALGNARWYLYNRPDTMGRGFAANFETTWRTKSEIMHQMRGAYITRELVIRSIPLLDEMRIVVVDGSEIGAPESSGENSKDDRVFATALAVRAWINWRRPEMLGQGLTWQRVMDEESGKATPQNKALNQIVQRFFLTAEQRAQMEDIRPSWRVDMGLS